MQLKQNEVNRVKEKYPVGTRIRLISMEDLQAVPSGTYGTVEFVDDAAQIHMKWDNGRGLALIPGEDEFVIDNQQNQKEEKIKVVIVEPGVKPRVELMNNSLEKMQEIVDGYIEELYLENDAVAICNEEGKLKNLEANRKIGPDIIAGTFFIAGDDGSENLVSLREDQINTYMERFQEIEQHTQEEMQDSIFIKMYGGM